MKYLIAINFLIFLFASCGNKYDKQFYGAYENMDSSRFFSKIKFYENNQYSFYRSTCFYHGRDSGNFILTDDTISFHSFNLPLDNNNADTSSDRNLNKMKFLYQSGKIWYIRKIVPVYKPSYFDTVLIGKKKEE